MNFFGIGGLEILLITIIGVTVVGPTRLIHGIRSFRNLMTELRRQKNDLMAVLLEAVDDDFEGPQMDPPFTLVLTEVSADASRVTGKARMLDVGNKAFPSETYNALRFAGLTR